MLKEILAPHCNALCANTDGKGIGEWNSRGNSPTLHGCQRIWFQHQNHLWLGWMRELPGVEGIQFLVLSEKKFSVRSRLFHLCQFNYPWFKLEPLPGLLQNLRHLYDTLPNVKNGFTPIHLKSVISTKAYATIKEVKHYDNFASTKTCS